MKLLPYDRFSFDFAESPAELVERLRAVVGAPVLHRRWYVRSEKPFTGDVRRRSFQMVASADDHSGVAVLCGELIETESGTRVVVRARPDAGLIIGAVFALILMPIIAALTARDLLAGDGSAVVFVVLAFMLFGMYRILYVGFFRAAERSQKLLVECLSSEHSFSPGEKVAAYSPTDEGRCSSCNEAATRSNSDPHPA